MSRWNLADHCEPAAVLYDQMVIFIGFGFEFSQGSVDDPHGSFRWLYPIVGRNRVRRRETSEVSNRCLLSRAQIDRARIGVGAGLY